MELAERPPDGLHKGQVQGLVIIVEVNPPAHPLDGRPPLGRVAHHNIPALFVVFVDSHSKHICLSGDLEGFVDFVFHRQAMGIPSKSPGDVESAGMCMSCNDVLDVPLDCKRYMRISYLDGSGQQVTVVRKTSGEWRPIVE